MLSVRKAKEMHCLNMSDIARVHFVRILFLQNQPNEVRVLSVSGQFATTTNLPAQNSHCTTESRIATGGDLTISICVACRMKCTLNES